MKKILNNIRYTVTANFITLFISVLITLVLPRTLGVANYGFYQLYIFYTSYASIFHLGLPDGIYLRIGGEHYNDIDKKDIKEQFISLIWISVVLGILTIFYAMFFSKGDKTFIIMVSMLSITVTNLKTYFLFILQATNRIKEYAKFTRIDRVIFCVISMFYVVLGGYGYRIVIFVDIVSRIIALGALLFSIKDILEKKISNSFLKIALNSYRNISIGSKLMLSYIAGLLIIGIIRFSIEKNWSIEVFGKVSLVLSLSNMMMTFINAVSVVLFPMLRRINSTLQKDVFFSLRNLLCPVAFSLLLFFLPIKFIISLWLPKYADSLFYFGILFPMFVYEGKVSLLSNTFLKALRKEKMILTVNIVSLIISVLLSFFSVYIFSNLTLAVLSILVVLIIRSNLSEYLVAQFFHKNLLVNMTVEMLLTLIFVCSNVFMGSLNAFFVYFVCLIIYLLYMKPKINDGFDMLKNI